MVPPSLGTTVLLSEVPPCWCVCVGKRHHPNFSSPDRVSQTTMFMQPSESSWGVSLPCSSLSRLLGTQPGFKTPCLKGPQSGFSTHAVQAALRIVRVVSLPCTTGLLSLPLGAQLGFKTLCLKGPSPLWIYSPPPDWSLSPLLRKGLWLAPGGSSSQSTLGRGLFFPSAPQRPRHHTMLSGAGSLLPRNMHQRSALEKGTHFQNL